MQRIILAVALLWTAAAANAAYAAGAVAEGIAAGGAQNGYSAGYSVNAADAAAATAQALENCKKLGNAASQQRCMTMMTFIDQCIAMAEDPQNGTPGVGWAVAAGKIVAESEATNRCKSTAGPDRETSCKIDVSACDGSAK